MPVTIPSDEELRDTYDPHISKTEGLRAVATLAAERAAKDTVLRIDKHCDDSMWAKPEMEGSFRRWLRNAFPSAFAPDITRNTFAPDSKGHGIDITPEPAMTKNARPAREVLDEIERNTTSDKPTHDEFTLRACIEVMRSCGCTEGEIARVAKLLPTKPAPGWVTVEEVGEVLYGIGIGIPFVNKTESDAICHHLRGLAATRGPMLTPEQAEEAARRCLGWMESPDPALLAALRRAATGESK